MPLTDTAIRTKKPGAKPSKYADGGGLYLEVRPTGTKLWRYRYRIGKAENIFAIGEYFDDKRSGHVSLEQARRARDDARVLVRKGVHPTHQRRQDRLVKIAEANNTFEGVAREWMGEHKEWSNYYRNQVKRTFEVDVFPKIGQIPIKEVEAAQLLAILRAIAARGAETVALNVRQWSSAIFRYAVSTLRADSDPAAALKGAIIKPPTKHSKALDQNELRSLALAIDGYAGYRTTVIGLNLLLLTFVRTIELRSAQWSDIDLDKPEWKVPARRMKKRVVHTVPLSRQSVALIKELKTLTGGGLLHAACANIFRFGKSDSSHGFSLPLHKHQAEAISLAAAGESYVLTTGTGSGKSLGYFIPIVDACLKAKALDPTKRTRAIVIYPMNALANSQLEELKKFLGVDPAERAVTFGRYTGQESDEERQAMAANPPDILLTNFMMLELLMTRQNDIDKAVMRNAKGLRFLILDELHTYRGRQGADVALLVRRVREALADRLICIGTSATMATDGTEMERNRIVADVASRLFGTPIPDRNVVTETLRRVTPETQTDQSVAPQLAAAIRVGIPETLDYDELCRHPMSVWVEMTLGLTYESGKPRRAKPLTLMEAANRLAAASGESAPSCLTYLQQFLLKAHDVVDATGKSLFAFKLHQFISGGGKVYVSLEAPGQRAITLEGQQFVPGDDSRQRRFYHAHFCRDCGQEYLPVWDADGIEGKTFEPRNIDERQSEDEQVTFGFLMPDATKIWDDTSRSSTQ
ncbi:MAG: phage integrase central domain-containing protein [Panacagrimonas sp.]